jgi:mycoredoxin
VKKIALVVLLAIVALNWGRISGALSSTQASQPLKEGDVVLYSTAWCGYCKLTRELFAREGIAFVEYDIEKSAQGKKLHSALGGGGVPVLEIRNKIIRGYDEQRIRAAIKG